MQLGCRAARRMACATPLVVGLPRLGCTEHEIAATLGMSLRMVARYTQAASQEHLADRALSRQLRAEHEQNLPNSETQVYPTAKKL